MDDQTGAALAVTQGDREAAATFYERYLSRPGEVPVSAHMRAGKIDDSPLVQAFARHRADALEEAARIAEETGNQYRRGIAQQVSASIALNLRGRAAREGRAYPTHLDQLAAKDARIAELEEGLRAIVAHFADRHQAPGHSHDVPGVWDADNPPGVAGTTCIWCAEWNAARALLAEKDTSHD